MYTVVYPPCMSVRTVASSPSSYPNPAGPVSHAASSNAASTQAAGGSERPRKNLQAAPGGTSWTERPPGGKGSSIRAELGAPGVPPTVIDGAQAPASVSSRRGERRSREGPKPSGNSGQGSLSR